jgi:hypothetical protein
VTPEPVVLSVRYHGNVCEVKVQGHWTDASLRAHEVFKTIFGVWHNTRWRVIDAVYIPPTDDDLASRGVVAAVARKILW